MNEALLESVAAIADARTNLGRQRVIVELAEERGLPVRRERIDLYTPQQNLIIDLPGSSDTIVYVVAHTDKTDIRPIPALGRLVNGLTDPLVAWTTLSDGAIDNATGVAVALELAVELASWPVRNLSWRVLLPGAEELGLRGTRAHLARLPPEEREAISLAFNLDTLGTTWGQNCVISSAASTPSLESLALDAAHDLGVALGREALPPGATSDQAIFAKNSFGLDFARGLLFAGPGGLLPQRSWFTGPSEADTLFISSCDLVSGGDILSALCLVPTGRLHGPRDSMERVSPQRLDEALTLSVEVVRRLDAQGTTTTR